MRAEMISSARPTLKRAALSVISRLALITGLPKAVSASLIQLVSLLAYYVGAIVKE